MALTAKQLIFVARYLQTWNATQAAIAAGYSPKTAYSIGAENLKKPEIAAEIRARVDAIAMSASEALVSLSERARAGYAPYIRANGTVDLEAMIADGKAHLIKRVRVTQWGVNVEFLDADHALELVAKTHGLFETKGSADDPIHNVSMTLEQWQAQQAERRAAAAATMGQFDDLATGD